MLKCFACTFSIGINLFKLKGKQKISEIQMLCSRRRSFLRSLGLVCHFTMTVRGFWFFEVWNLTQCSSWHETILNASLWKVDYFFFFFPFKSQWGKMLIFSLEKKCKILSGELCFFLYIAKYILVKASIRRNFIAQNGWGWKIM